MKLYFEFIVNGYQQQDIDKYYCKVNHVTIATVDQMHADTSLMISANSEIEVQKQEYFSNESQQKLFKQVMNAYPNIFTVMSNKIIRIQSVQQLLEEALYTPVNETTLLQLRNTNEVSMTKLHIYNDNKQVIEMNVFVNTKLKACLENIKKMIQILQTDLTALSNFEKQQISKQQQALQQLFTDQKFINEVNVNADFDYELVDSQFRTLQQEIGEFTVQQCLKMNHSDNEIYVLLFTFKQQKINKRSLEIYLCDENKQFSKAQFLLETTYSDGQNLQQILVDCNQQAFMADQRYMFFISWQNDLNCKHLINQKTIFELPHLHEQAAIIIDFVKQNKYISIDNKMQCVEVNDIKANKYYRINNCKTVDDILKELNRSNCYIEGKNYKKRVVGKTDLKLLRNYMICVE